MYARHILKQAPKAGGWLVKHMLTAADLAERGDVDDRGDMGDKDDKADRDDKGDMGNGKGVTFPPLTDTHT